MCTVCGCGRGETKIEGEHEHRHADGTVHSHIHEHTHDREAAHRHAHDGFVYAPRPRHHRAPVEPAHGDGNLHFGTGAAGAPEEVPLGGAHAPGLSQRRMVQIEQDILSKNNAYADVNRQLFAAQRIFALNLVSSPGSGKTTLLVKSIEMLEGRLPLAVIEGDQQTSNDAERIRATGAPAIQVNTGKGCHLDAHMIGHALERFDLAANSLLLIENVGNLVCPAEFDLGEAHKVVILSVTEGEDKPLKYPNMFAASDLMLLTKVDLLPHLTFDVARCIEYARRINPRIEVLQVSSVSGAGMLAWLAWLERGVAAAQG